MTISEEDLWGPVAPHFVGEGDVLSFKGKHLLLRTIIQRAWGWPKKAAYEAGDVIVRLARECGARPMVAIADRERLVQQRDVISRRPAILDYLLSGLASDFKRERFDAGHEIQQVVVSFDELVDDSGFTRSIVRALANRLGCTLDDVREITHFNTDSSVIQMRVNTREIDLDLASTVERKAG